MPKGNKFKGTDRRIIEKTRFMLTKMKERDAYLVTVTGPPTIPTSKISIRQPMIPAMEPTPATGITTAIDTLIAQCNALLALHW